MSTSIVVYTPQDLQSVLGISKNTAYALVNEDGFPSVRIGRKIIIYEESLKEWLKLKGRT